MAVGTPRWVGAAFACAAVGLALHIALTTLSDPEPTGSSALEGLYLGLIAFSALACLLRWQSDMRDRAAWACLTLALVAWTAGEAYHVFFLSEQAVTPFPSVSDGFFVLYPLCFTAVCLRVKGHVDRIGVTLLLDGFIAATAACAVVSSLTLIPALGALADSAGPLKLVFNLAYPVGDVILVGALAGGASLVGGRIGRDFTAIGAGLIVVATADVLYLAQSVDGIYSEGAWIDSLWPAGLLTIAWGGWTKAGGGAERPSIYSRVPVVSSLAAVGILAVGSFADVDRISQALATVAVIGVVARMHLALRENRQLLEASRREALADPLTGLANRRQLVIDLDAALQRGTGHHLFIFDLDGFKHFNDTFGHPAGDELLIRLGRALAERLSPDATPFRLGGDEFCVLVDDERRDAALTLVAARSALTEEGDGYRVDASWGQVAIPREAEQATDAVVLADRRMYERKRRKRPGRDHPSIAA